MSTTREAILEALVAMLAGSNGFFPAAVIDEPEPSHWDEVAAQPPGTLRLLHAVAVQDGPPPDVLSVLSGPEGENLYELELEAAVAYAVRAEIGAGDTNATGRSARRARRDEGVENLAALIAADRTLGLGPEVYAELQPAQRDDDVAFPNAPATATAVGPIRVLYTAAHAAG
ncbi:hypothetical protein KOAAANKH_00099 [Brevundimonas sp. NIBR10]|uniref:hypothetical protein n=1 Tax=Brevundimonas sp. NIBR10 TaxID=3015997 RepID=UPI0022F1D445|nr:hypothetical protein [Brevundimonas sp. NIBR10]WGM45238.1 hypothetical protein KOAAANKH_00099 [Brevundimonas sp. NIBR10]